MAYLRAIHGAEGDNVHAPVHRLSGSDLGASLAAGFKDFVAMPSATLFVGLIYPIIGLILARVAFRDEMIPLLFPLIAGFALIGPVAAIGLYEMSRRRELGEEVSLLSAFTVFRSAHFGAIVALGGLLTFIFFLWMMVAEGIYNSIFGYVPVPAFNHFTQVVLTTRAGLELIVLGNIVGFIFAAFVFAISVVSFPMILDRGVGASTAVETSVRVVLANPVVMALWGIIIVAGLVIGALPALIGLIIIMPVLGHASWHLYRKAVG